MPQAMKIPDAKAAVDQEWEKTRENTGMAADESQKRFASLTGVCHLKNSELEPKFQKYKRPSCTPRRHGKR